MQTIPPTRSLRLAAPPFAQGGFLCLCCAAPVGGSLFMFVLRKLQYKGVFVGVSHKEGFSFWLNL